MENRDVLIKAAASVSDRKYLSSFLKREFNNAAVSDYTIEEFKDDCLLKLSGIQSLLDDNTKMRTRAALDVIHRIDKETGEFAPTKTEYTKEQKEDIKTDYLTKIANKKLGSCYLKTSDDKFNHRFHQEDIDDLTEALNKINLVQNTKSASLEQHSSKVKIICKHYAIAYILDEVSKGLEVFYSEQKNIEETGKIFTNGKYAGNSFYKDVKFYYKYGDYKDVKFLDDTLANWRKIVPKLTSAPDRIKTYIDKNY